MMSALSMIKYSHRKKNQFFKKSTAILVAGALLCSIILPPYAFTYQRSCISFVEKKSAENHNMRERSNLFGDAREARRVLLKDSIPHGSPEILSDAVEELFVAPYREFLDTFNPVQFFKSHKEQTLGQAIGIVLIWGAMVATMIGAPFGIDYLISGSAANHLGITLLSSFIGSLSIVAGIKLNHLKENKNQLNQLKQTSAPHSELKEQRSALNVAVQELIYSNQIIQTGYTPNRTERLILSVAYLSYPVNVLSHHLFNLISNLTRPLGKWRLDPLTKTGVGVDQYDWETREQGIENVRDGIKKNRPDLLERYENLNQLTPKEREQEEKSLRNELYRITQGHLRVWGLGATLNSRQTPYFHGSHIQALILVFPDLNLNPLGFQLDWSDEGRAIESVRYILSKEVPHIMARYERIAQLNDRELHDLRNEIYGITLGYFQVWGLSVAMNQKLAPYFYGSYINVLMALFPDLNLNPLGFQLDWSDEGRAIESVRYILSKEVPHILERYERIVQLNDRELHDLRNEIYGISNGHFDLWGLSGAMSQKVAPYFYGSYINVLMVLFPDLNLNPLGFQLDWLDEGRAIESVRYILSKEVPDIMARYEGISQLNDRELHDLRNEIYGITQAHFQVWGLSRTINRQATPYFHGSYINVLISVFNHPRLELTLQGFRDYRKATFERKYSWKTPESGIWSVREGIRSNFPNIIERYENLAQLEEDEIERLKRDIYGITQGHFYIWGIGAAMNRKIAPYFYGSLINALKAVFPDLNLNPLGFQLDWSSQEKGIESVKYVLSREILHLMQEYERIAELSDREIHDLRNEIYRIIQGHFNVWGLGAAMNQKLAPYFHGSYINVLMAVFPELNLNPLGFQLDWSSEEKGIESVRYVLTKEIPHIMQQYEKLDQLNDTDVHDLRNEIYKITSSHFKVWGLGMAIDDRKAPYFHGSYIVALMAVFPDLNLNLNPLGFQLDWSSEEKGIKSVRYVLSKESPYIMQKYGMITQLDDRDVRELRNKIYGITKAHLYVWGLNGAMDRRLAPYFNGSYKNALMAVFPDLNLNPLGFELDWSSEENGIESVKHILSKEVPHIMARYEGIAQLNDRELHDLRNEIYGITHAHFKLWGLGNGVSQESALYFNGNYRDVLISVFNHPRLELTLQGFRDYRRATFEKKYSWGTLELGIWSVREGIKSNRPDIIVRYENLGQLKEDEIERLRRDIYRLTRGHFNLWGLGGAMNQRLAPYFHGSHIPALIAAFPHPKLGLTREGFLERSENGSSDTNQVTETSENSAYRVMVEIPRSEDSGSNLTIEDNGTGDSASPLMTEDTRNEAVKRGMNPNGWITQLFFAPHYEFLDTFNPVQFFKSHREQTLGQAIGIVLILGAMVATMIGAPFGIDYIISGSPTNHLGITLLSSFIGSLSIVAGIRLNQLIQTSYKPNRTEKFILSIAYLSYPVNVLSHHLFNLISNLTRPLGKWRLDPLTQANGTDNRELYHWGTEEQGIKNVKDAINKNKPELLERYAKLDSLGNTEREREKKSLRAEVYKITSAHFQHWGIQRALDKRGTPYFHGSYIRALMAVFPELELEPLDIQLNWSSKEKAIDSIFYVFLREIPHIVQQYNDLDNLDPAKVEALKNENYQMTAAHFDVLGLANVTSKKHVPYFNGSYIQALIALFPNLNLDPLGFELDWSSLESGIKSVLYIFKRQVPYLIQDYERFAELTELELSNLRKEICSITKAHFTSWGLGSALVQRVAPYFHGSYKNVLITLFTKLNLNPLEFQLDWSNEERAIDSMRFVFSSEIPNILRQYDQLKDLSPIQIERLKDEIYQISSAHFDVWGLANATSKKNVPYFNGSYIQALMAVFPDLNLNPLGFQLDWSSKQRAIDSMRFVISIEMPSLITRYENIDRFSAGEVQRLRNEIYSITQGHFQLWGLAKALHRDTVPDFEGSYMKALVELFDHPRLVLSVEGFINFRKSNWQIRYSWRTRDSGIFNIRDALGTYQPALLAKYDRLDSLREEEKNELRNDVYRITQAHFKVWGLSSAMDREKAPYFNGSYIVALMAVFPNLNLNQLGFELDWSSKERGIESVRYVLLRVKSDLVELYDHLSNMNPHKIRAFRNAIYRITYGHFGLWGLNGALSRDRAPYFNGSYVEALMALFPDLNLNSLGFKLDWSTQEKGIESVQFIFDREIPSIVQQYERVDQMSKDEVEELKNRIYALSEAELKMWGLSRAMHRESAPYFHGSYIEALMAVFPKLDLNPLGFQLDWSSKERALDSIRFILTRKVPHIMQRYQNIESLNDLELTLLREGIYRIKRAHLLLWKLGAVFSTTYFNDFIELFLNLFSHPKLGLSREGFVERNENGGSAATQMAETTGDEDSGSSVMREIVVDEGSGSNLTRDDSGIGDSASPLMTEDTRREAMGRGMNPNSWIAQLFFAPHYEFLDTFNPIQFFKSHKEQTLGQAIGIVLIWGAMVAAMIGAPFGIDFLLSGNPINHLGITLLSSFIGSLSIVAGIRLNQLKENERRLNQLIQTSYKPNRTEKIILSIAYLSYPINVLTHHLYNLISQFTRPLGKRRLAPLTKIGVGVDQYDWEIREQGIENVKDAIRKNHPDLLERYENLNQLLSKEREREKESLRNETYRITQGHFSVWGLSGAMNQRLAPYFHGSYINALMAVFPQLNLNPLGFRLDWSSEEKGIESVKYVLFQEIPHIMQKYEKIAQLSDQEVYDLRNAIHGIKQGHFMVWGLSGALTQITAPYFNGSYIDALMAVFPQLNLNPLGFELDWSSEEKGIESVKYVLSQEVPHIMQQYEKITQLSDREVYDLRNAIYGIKQGHFKVWGLSGTVDQKLAPYFHGSHMNVLISIFNHPRLGLTLKGFKDFRKATFEQKYSWKTLESGIWNVIEEIRTNRPDIIERYENLAQLEKDEIERLKRDIYGIKQGHFQVWGLGSVMNQESAPYFHGSYINALMAVFPDLNLNPLGFQLDWSSEEKGIESVKYVLSKEVSHIIQQYGRISQLNERDVHDLRNKIYGITYGHFKIWGLNGAMNQKLAPYFNGSYIDALMAVFPQLNLNPLGFELDWSSEEKGIESVKYVLSKEVPHIMHKYERIAELNDRDIHDLRNEIYRITVGHFKVWGLSGAMNQKLAPYFHGSYMNALITVFPDLNLDPLGFQLDWSSEEKGIESVKYVFSKKVPHLMHQYGRLDELSGTEIHNLRKEIYRITQGHFEVWGLGGAISQQVAPYFYGSYMNALITVFPDLNLDPLGFRLDWSSEEKGIESVKYVLSKEVPHIMQQYERINKLSDREIHELRNEIHGIIYAHFQVWGLSGAMTQITAPYFNGSHINALITVFSHPKLGLTREGFVERHGNGSSAATQMAETTGDEDSGSSVMREIVVDEGSGSNLTRDDSGIGDSDSPLMTEDTRREAMGRGMNPNSWIAQLFFAPHYEFLDTFNPVQFFKSHKEQTLGQAIGIVLIWGAMVAAMIGAPFGIDYLISGSAANHLGITLLSSFIGSISIVAGIRLNQLKENERRLNQLIQTGYISNRTEKFILSIAYLSYPINVLTHHLYNLISQFTRPLGKWSLAPFTKGTSIYKWEREEDGIESVRDGIRKNRPDLLERYENLGQLDPQERKLEAESLRNEIYGITFGHFQVWGLRATMNRRSCPYFYGSHINALKAVFPNLNLNSLGFELDWSSKEKGIESIRYELSQEVPQLMQQYKRIVELSDREIDDLRNEVYRITQAHFKLWGLGRAIDYKAAPYFHGSYINALMLVFPKLDLNPLGFQLDWSSQQKAIASVKYVLSQVIPHVIVRYDKLRELHSVLREEESELLRNRIYRITKGHFQLWGLSSGLKYFKSYTKALTAVFPDLNLNPFGFQLDWSSREKAIESIRYVFNREIPHIIRHYNRIARLNESEIEKLRDEIYSINKGYFRSWGFGAAQYSIYFPSHIDILIEFFPKLQLNPLSFQLDWSSREKAIESIQYVLSREVPYIQEQYGKIDKLTPSEIQDLRNRIYGISQAHFKVWGLSGAMDTRIVPEFEGNYRDVLLAIFSNPKLGLTLQGFKDYRKATFEQRYSWKTRESGIWSVREGIRNNRPNILERYENLGQLNKDEIERLKRDIYGISSGHFQVWSLGAAMNREKVPYFQGSYIVALMMVFPDLNLNRLGFRLDWSSKEKGIESVRYVLTQVKPDLIQRYDNRTHLNEVHLNNLENEIVKITSNHFEAWGLFSVMDKEKTEYFNGSFIKALTLVFPDLNLNPLGFQLDWSSEEKGIESVKYVLSQEIPHLMQQYEKLDQLSDKDIHHLKNAIYGINYGHFMEWGLSGAMDHRKASYFQGSHIAALMAVFPNLNLNPLGFQLDWSSKKKGFESVRYVLSQEVPHIMQEYEKLDRLNTRNIHVLRNKIYGITSGHFYIWGLGAAMNQKLAPYFHGSHMDALMAVFPDLNLDPLGFKLDWSSEEKGIESVKYVLSIEAPHIMRQYERIAQLNDKDVHELRKEIYGITQGHFNIWGLGVAMNQRLAPYFHGSHIAALIAAFSHPKLALTREGFVERSENGSSGDILMTEDTRREALKREMNPNGWITQLFFAPHYEFLDTFNPVQFFKSHKEQTLGQAIGIVLIWGAMVATMIGAPFGIDYLISGNPTNHLGITLVSSFIGSLSIVAGIRLNQVKENERRLNQLIQTSYKSNRTEKFILSIAYLSYPINVLTHHLYNLISQFTRPLGKWRLDPLTKARVGEDPYNWVTREQGIESVRDAIRKNRPDLLERYENLDQLDPRKRQLEEESLRKNIYRITSGHFKVWGLGGAISQQLAPYFHGSYITALITVFPELNLNPLGFRLDWSNEERGIESVKYVLSKEVPHIMQQYERISQLNERDMHDLKNKIYGITYGHFKIWGLSAAMTQESAPYFHGSHIQALILVFPDLNLNSLGFQLDWSDEKRAIESVRYILSKEVPHLMRQHERITQLNDREVHDLINEIYGITQAHFQVWGLSRAINRQATPYFHGSYIDALMAVFSDLNLNPLGFKLDWSSKERGIESMRYVLSKEAPHIMRQYERITQLNDKEVHDLRNAIYGIKQGHFKVWGLSGAMNREKAPYFHGSYINVLIFVFSNPRLELTLQGFRDYRRATFERKYSWGTLELGIWSVREGIRSNRPDIIARYENLGQLKEDEIERLKRDIYRLIQGHFNLWGLGGAMDGRKFPYFNGTYINGLMAVFPDLNLNPLGFQLDWSNEEKGIKSIRYVLSKEVPHLMQQYERISQLNERDMHDLRNEIYKINVGHFNVWGLGAAMNHRQVPYFYGSYIDALMALFPELNLNPLGFQLDWSNEGRGIESVKYVLSREISHLMQQYERIAELSDREIHDLRNEIYGITSGHFEVWGLREARDQKVTPYFHGSYINALISVFSTLNLNPLGFKLDWSNEERGIESVRYVLSRETPHIMQQYKRLDQLGDRDVHDLRNEIYRITQAHFNIWGLDAAMIHRQVPYFHGSYMNALMAVFPHSKLGLTREGFVERTGNGATDILEPLVQPQSRFKTWKAKAAYYLFVGSWEEVIYRWGGLVGLPLLLSLYGFDSVLISYFGLDINMGQILGVVWSSAGFLFSHTIVRWLAKRKSVDWDGWKMELKKDFLSLKSFHTLLYNLLFISIISFQPSLVSFALLSVSSLHFTMDMLDAYKKRRLTSQELLSQEMQLIADELGTSQPELQHLSLDSNLNFSTLIQTLFGVWSKDTKGSELYLVDLTGSRDKASQIAMLRTIHEIYGLNQNARFILVMDEPKPIEELEAILGIQGILFAVSNAEDAITQTKALLKQGSYAVRLVAASNKIGIWSNLMDELGKTVRDIHILVLQILDVGVAIKIVLPRDKFFNAGIEEWIRNLKGSGRIERNGRELTIQGVELEPPSFKEDHQLHSLFSSQA